jgi:hypothetical protein
VQTLQKYGQNWSDYDYLIEDTRRLLNGMQEWQIIHVRLEFNGEVLYRLVNEALSLCKTLYFYKEVFPCIFDIIVVERCA